MARPGLDEAIAFRLAKALHAAEKSVNEKLSESTAANTLAAVPDRKLLHPGVMAYFRQAGLAQ
jgi:TRAP-type uncharacterized transport system substrate-binding protein